jgi:LCP family protein required for cell wall assembly
VAVLVVLWLAYMIAVPVIAWNRVDRVDAEPDGARPPEQPGTTYLLVGSDSREGLTPAQRRRLGTGDASGRRTDTIMLLHTGDGPNLLMSIPRDSQVEVPGHGTTKINAAYALGGAELLVQTVENSTGIRVDDYIEIGFGGFVRMVNAVGGIEICPEEDMNDPLANLDIKAGCQEANGRKALGYARSRHTSGLGDIDRAARQREVVSQIGSRAFSPATILNPVKYYRLAFAGSESVVVGENVSAFDFARFTMAMRSVDGDKGLTCGVPIRDLAVNWDEERAQRLFALIKEDRTAQVGRDLCQQSGLAG